MAFEDTYIAFLQKLPGITEPVRRLNFKDKLKWTGIILLLYFVMGQVSIYGVDPQSFEQFQFLAILLANVT